MTRNRSRHRFCEPRSLFAKEYRCFLTGRMLINEERYGPMLILSGDFDDGDIQLQSSTEDSQRKQRSSPESIPLEPKYRHHLDRCLYSMRGSPMRLSAQVRHPALFNSLGTPRLPFMLPQLAVTECSHTHALKPQSRNGSHPDNVLTSRLHQLSAEIASVTSSVT